MTPARSESESRRTESAESALPVVPAAARGPRQFPGKKIRVKPRAQARPVRVGGIPATRMALSLGASPTAVTAAAAVAGG